MSRLIDEHRLYLSDRPRLDAFAAAIANAVRAGDVVVDLACGTGIFGLMACRAGARRVYAIDDGDMLALARSLAVENGYGDRVVAVPGFSLDVALPERADVIVCDQMGHFGWEAGVLEYFRDAHQRFLRPGGRLIPAAIDLVLAPVTLPDVWEGAAFWATRPAGFSMRSALDVAWNSGHPHRVEERDLLGPGVHAAMLDPAADNSHLSLDVTLRVEREGVLHGIAGWFVGHLDDRVSITNAPGHPARIDRRNAVFLVPDAPAVAAGDRVRVTMSIRPRDLLVNWQVEHHDRRWTQSTFRGMLIWREDVRRTRPDFVPELTPRGLARRLVVDMVDGSATVRDIEAALLDEHPTLFDTPADAARFVAEVVTRYAR